jgi:hypothetical protein
MVSSTYEDEKDWLVTLVHFPPEYPEEHAAEAETLGHLLGYADITNTRCLALVGDREAGVYEILLSFDCAQSKTEFMGYVAAAEGLGQDFIQNGLSVPSASEIERSLPVSSVIPPTALVQANLVAQLIREAAASDPDEPVN